MSGLDDLYSQIPVQQIAGRLGVDEGEVDRAVKTLVPVLVGGLQRNAEDPDTAQGIASAADSHARSGLLDGGVSVDQVDEADGSRAIAKIFSGNYTGQVASALSGGGAGNSDLIQKLLPILAPIVLAYIGKRLSGGQAQQVPGQSGGGGIGDILGSILGGGAKPGGNNPLGSILGSILGGDKAGGVGDILGGLLGGKK
ncbi:DUF937 domain-containing protein [Mycobacterium kyogaense]|uniref:DUF937 domain-containing protein n=1 Tax=Mycobacterium kyogaense TaxID=2212479 RepID=UPI000DAC5349|nr:DUF937 domain-containing protein [Mycobacterium kyogaense]